MKNETLVLHVVLVPPEGLFMFWPEVSRLLLDNPETWNKAQTIADIHSAITAGRLQLWVSIDVDQQVYMAALTELKQFPVHRILHVVWGAGKYMDVIFEAGLSAMESYAKAQGATAIAIDGRPGFIKRAKKLGYEFVQTTVMKELPEERPN